jgi:hypothetical protein
MRSEGGPNAYLGVYAQPDNSRRLMCRSNTFLIELFLSTLNIRDVYAISDLIPADAYIRKLRSNSGHPRYSIKTYQYQAQLIEKIPVLFLLLFSL